jgi:choline-sulfatase
MHPSKATYSRLTLLSEPFDVQDYYYNNRDQIFIPPSIKDSMHDSAYAFENQRKFKKQAGPYKYDDDDKIAELTAIYYGLIEEVDSYVGEIVRRIDESGLRRDTMIVLTSDHGDMLGKTLPPRPLASVENVFPCAPAQHSPKPTTFY